jgi:hypothetical protein
MPREAWLPPQVIIEEIPADGVTAKLGLAELSVSLFALEVE